MYHFGQRVLAGVLCGSLERQTVHPSPTIVARHINHINRVLQSQAQGRSEGNVYYDDSN
jgi:hypothetical protein